MKILVSGASGLVGTALTGELTRKGHRVARLVRPGRSRQEGDATWDPASRQIDASALEGADAIVHLSGESIAGSRWTEKRKAALRNSRIDTTRLLVDAFRGMKNPPKVFISASAVGYYGNRGDEVLTEASAPGNDFLAELARDWEAEARRAEALGMRTVIPRFGVILAADGGALPQMLLPFRFGLGGRLGNGRQWFPWVALADVVAILCQALADERYAGPINTTAPDPIRNEDFTRIVASTLHRPALFPAPRFALRLALGEMADGAVLASQRAVPARLEELGYRFQFPSFEPASRAILASKK